MCLKESLQGWVLAKIQKEGLTVGPKRGLTPIRGWKRNRKNAVKAQKTAREGAFWEELGVQ